MADELQALMQDFQQPTGGGWSPGFQDRAKKKKQLQTAAKAIFQALEPAENPMTGEVSQHPLKMDKTQFDLLSADDQINSVGALIKANVLKSAMAEAKQKQDLSSLQQIMEAIKIKGAAGELAGDEALENVLRSAGSQTVATPAAPGLIPSPGQATVPRDVTAQSILQALAQNPAALRSRSGPQVLSSAMREGTGAPKGLTFIKSPTGADIALSPDTGAFQYDPYSKAQAQGSALSARDALRAYNENQKLLKEFQDDLDLARKPDSKLGFDEARITTEIKKIESEQEQLRALAGLSKESSPQAKSTPATPPQFKKGERVKQNGVTYEFDGQKWNPVK